jgi:hypothetical protein
MVTTVMTPVEELLAQRDAVLLGEWVQGDPKNPGQACLVIRCQLDGLGLCQRILPVPAQDFISATINGFPFSWNDQPGRTKEEVLEALDQAIRLAKEAEDSLVHNLAQKRP